MLSDIPAQIDDRVLVDFRTADDAGVYKWESGPSLVQTVDFFTPIVDDPYEYGQIAAANSLSDVYAMGGVPLTAMNIVCFPMDEQPHAVLVEILRGGGFTTGGLNFDAKLRRQSIARDDLFHAHIGGMDTMARALLAAASILESGDLDRLRATAQCFRFPGFL